MIYIAVEYILFLFNLFDHEFLCILVFSVKTVDFQGIKFENIQRRVFNSHLKKTIAKALLFGISR